MVIQKIVDYYNYLKHKKLNNIEELKNRFRKCGYYVDDEKNEVILNVYKNKHLKVTMRVNLNDIINNFKEIVKNRKQNGWEKIFNKLLKGGE